MSASNPGPESDIARDTQLEPLQICDNAPDTEKDRPKSFGAKAGSGYTLVTLKRRK